MVFDDAAFCEHWAADGEVGSYQTGIFRRMGKVRRVGSNYCRRPNLPRNCRMRNIRLSCIRQMVLGALLGFVDGSRYLIVELDKLQ
jgi:hypothetical protein